MSFLHVGITDIYQTINTLHILRLSKPVSEVTCITASSSLTSIMDSGVRTPMSMNYIIKVIRWYCNTIAIGDISYRYLLIWSQFSTNRFMTPRASESGLSYTHRVCNGLMIAAPDRTLNLTMLDWSQIYSILPLGHIAIYGTESIPRNTQHMNWRSDLPRLRKCGWTKGWFL